MPEADDAVDIDPVTKAPLSIGEALETGGGGPKHNSHFFDALLDNVRAIFPQCQDSLSKLTHRTDRDGFSYQCQTTRRCRSLITRRHGSCSERTARS